VIRASDKKLITDFEELVDTIKSSTGINPYESAGDKRKRIELALSSYELFCLEYFPEYCFAPMAWFHKQFFPYIIDNPREIYLLQIFREGAKTTHSGLLMPMYMHCKGLYYGNTILTGMIVGSHDEHMAAEKLMDIQANLEGNQRLINDFGEQMSWGNWEDGAFKTKHDIAFYGFGKKQSPRGTKFKWRRPNYGLIDDLNDSRQLKNDAICQEDMTWVLGEFKPALWIKRWWMVVPQNKFHDNTVTALLENKEDIKTIVLRADMKNAEGKSNWPENFTDEDIAILEESEGGSFIRERMNTPFEEGTIFSIEDLPWAEPLPLEKYKGVLIHYLDPSYKATDKSDFKAWVLIGKTPDNKYDILKARVKREGSKTMWEYAFDMDEWVGEKQTIKHAMEANFIQEDIHAKELERVEKDKNKRLRVHMDRRDKPNKFERIESLSPLFKRKLIRFNIHEKEDEGMKLLRKQLLAFEKGSSINDDGPDAVEGAIWICDRYGGKGSRIPRSGKYNKNQTRSV
jgi:hypothetical protein